MYLNLEMTRTDRQRIIKSFFLAYIPDRIRQVSVVKSPARQPYDGRVRASRNCPPLSPVFLWMHLHVFYQSFVNVHTPIYLFRNTRVQLHVCTTFFTYVKRKVIFVFKYIMKYTRKFHCRITAFSSPFDKFSPIAVSKFGNINQTEFCNRNLQITRVSQNCKIVWWTN